MPSAAPAGVHIRHARHTPGISSALGNVQLETKDGKTVDRIMGGSGVNMRLNGGETAEIKATPQARRKNGYKIIVVTGVRKSWSATFDNDSLLADVYREGGPWDSCAKRRTHKTGHGARFQNRRRIMR